MVIDDFFFFVVVCGVIKEEKSIQMWIFKKFWYNELSFMIER